MLKGFFTAKMLKVDLNKIMFVLGKGRFRKKGFNRDIFYFFYRD